MIKNAKNLLLIDLQLNTFEFATHSVWDSMNYKCIIYTANDLIKLKLVI